MSKANNGAYEAMKTHMTGLSRMIDLRGGFKNANFPPSIQRQIAWADLQTSNILSMPPKILPFSSPALDISPYNCTTTLPDVLASTTACPSTYTIDFETITTDLRIIFSDLRYLTSVLDTQSPSSIKERDSMWYSDKMYISQRNLNYSSMYPSPEHTKLDTACCVAASIFAHVYLRDLGFFSKVVDIMITRFKSSLEDISSEGLDEDVEGRITLFWALIIAGISAFGKSERLWFVERLRVLSERMEIEGPRDAEERVRKILWSEEWTTHLDTLWEELNIS